MHFVLLFTSEWIYHCLVTCVMHRANGFSSLMLQVEANSDFTNEKRVSVSFMPNDPAATLFLQV